MLESNFFRGKGILSLHMAGHVSTHTHVYYLHVELTAQLVLNFSKCWGLRHCMLQVTTFHGGKLVLLFFCENGPHRSRTWNMTRVDFRADVCENCMGNICLGKCSVLHCSLWAVQSINFLFVLIHNTECSNSLEINCKHTHIANNFRFLTTWK